MCSFSGRRILAKMRGTIFSPTKLWLWKVQPCLSSQCLVAGLPMSWKSAAALGSHVVKHLHGVQEVVFVASAIHGVHAFQAGKLGADEW